jgi:hypothetical protein
MAGRRWDERDHPRWPRGSGDKSGEFRDTGPDWAQTAALPAGRYGSIATGQTSQCPVCGRTVKVVGTTGKQSTHNGEQGKRCEGSGTVADSIQVQDVRVRRAEPPRRNQEVVAPPPPPKVRPGRPTAQIDDPVALDRFINWQTHAARRPYEEVPVPKRERQIAAAVAEVQDLTRDLQRARSSARHDIANELMREHGWAQWGRIPFEERQVMVDEEADQRAAVVRAKKNLEDHQAYLDDLRTQPPGFYSQRLGVRIPMDADDPDPYQNRRALRGPIDPANPLAIYGDWLRIPNPDWLTYQALDSLEQRVPPQLHELLAQHLVQRPASNSVGIWISGQRAVPDMDDLGDLRNKQPRGWHKGATWKEVDGVVRGGVTMAVGYTDNYEAALRQQQRIRRGTPMEDKPFDASATLHEFGHMIDSAIGDGDPSAGVRFGLGRASSRRLWRLVHGEVLREAGHGLNPYYKQRGGAGAEEFFADAFGRWAESDPTSTPLMPSITWRQRHIAAAYDIPYGVAVKVDEYFDRLVRDVQTGLQKKAKR